MRVVISWSQDGDETPEYCACLYAEDSDDATDMLVIDDVDQDTACVRKQALAYFSTTHGPVADTLTVEWDV